MKYVILLLFGFLSATVSAKQYGGKVYKNNEFGVQVQKPKSMFSWSRNDARSFIDYGKDQEMIFLFMDAPRNSSEFHYKAVVDIWEYGDRPNGSTDAKARRIMASLKKGWDGLPIENTSFSPIRKKRLGGKTVSYFRYLETYAHPETREWYETETYIYVYKSDIGWFVVETQIDTPHPRMSHERLKKTVEIYDKGADDLAFLLETLIFKI